MQYFSKYIHPIYSIILDLFFKTIILSPNTAGIFLNMPGYCPQVFADQGKIYPG